MHALFYDRFAVSCARTAYFGNAAEPWQIDIRAVTLAAIV